MVVRNWMKEVPAAAGPATMLGQAVDLFSRHAMPVLPVVDSEGHLFGVVTARALLAEVARAGRSFADRSLLGVVERGARTVTPESSLQTAVKFFCEDPHLEALPVVERGRLRGLLSRLDALRALALRSEGAGRHAVDVTRPSFDLSRPAARVPDPDPSVYLS